MEQKEKEEDREGQQKEKRAELVCFMWIAQLVYRLNSLPLVLHLALEETFISEFLYRNKLPPREVFLTREEVLLREVLTIVVKVLPDEGTF